MWDAETYDLISTIQERWGLELLARRIWQGNEIVLDAGCGSGRITRYIADKVPDGDVFAVDIDSAMVDLASKRLRNYANVQVIEDDISKFGQTKVFDVIFSNAVLHWIKEHDRIFKNFFRILKSDGDLIIQCGGHGNLETVHNILNQIKESENFRKYYTGWQEEWYFARPENTIQLLKKIGFKEIDVYLSNSPEIFKNKNLFILYLKTVVGKPYLAYLPESLHDLFVRLCVGKIQSELNSWKLDYIRLNIKAKKP